MSDFDLLSAVQPSDGWFAIVGIKGKDDVRQKLVATREEADQVVTDFSAQKRNVFFGVAKFKTNKGRTKDNVQALKSFWLDIDCGEEKAVINEKTGRPNGYVDQNDGLQAIVHFCVDTGLPKPTVVNSGRGLHVYWWLEEAITREQWEPVAHRLRELCNERELYVDPAVFEVARILRVPGTFNYKSDPPEEVTVIRASKPVSFKFFKTTLGVQEQKATAPKRELSELAKSLQANIDKSFTKIMRRSMAGNGCNQLKACYEERSTLPEVRWFDALSIAKFCKDSDTAIHRLSEGHPGYDPTATEKKIAHIGGPHSCAEFEKNNPGGCKGCPFKKTITTPIMLGAELSKAEPEDNVIVEEVEAGGEDTDAKTYVIPEYPRPYARGRNGGIYLILQDQEEEPVLVYHNDLYVVKRMLDPIEGDVIVMRLHTPCDGVRDFTIPNKTVMKREELGSTLASKGVVCASKQFTLVIDYVIASINSMQNKGKAEHMRMQFGWADNDSKFIVGDREIGAEGTFHSPPSSVTKKMSEWMTPVGSMEKWKEVFSLYGRPGLEPNAFAALSAFGSPILKFLGQNGVIINLINSRSGTGKTTSLHMCNSVYGHPKLLCAVKADTMNAKLNRLGIMNNLPFTVDEMTNTNAAEFSELAYCMSQGRGKDRLKQSTNEMRVNLTSWACISVCSSNASFYEKLTSSKRSPDGEMMRLMEYKIDYTDSLDPAFAKQMFDHQLMENYGHAGDIYIDWLVKNLEEVKDTALATQAKIDRELKLTQRERIWSAALAANLTGGRIAKRLGLIDWDMSAIYTWAASVVMDMRNEVVPPISNVASVIAEFLNRHVQNYVVIKDEADKRSGFAPMPIQEPRGELMIRQEPDTKRLYIAVGPFREDCVKYQISYKETLKELRAKGMLINVGNKRLSKGMSIDTGSVHSLWLDMTHPEFSFLTAGMEDDDAGGES